MKNVIDGFEINEQVIKVLKDWSPENNLNESRARKFIDELTELQDFLSRKIEDFDSEEFLTIGSLLSNIVFMKDSLREVGKIWHEKNK